MAPTVHHIGCLVHNINEAVADYRVLYPAGIVSELFHIGEQRVDVCFFDMGNIHIEFVAPLDKESFLYRILEKQPGFYHIGVFAGNIDAEIERLEKQGYRKINQFKSPAFNNRYCAFLMNHERHMIELIQRD